MVSDYTTLLENLRARKLAQVDPVRTLATNDLPSATPSFRSPAKSESRKVRAAKAAVSGSEFADFLSNDVFAHLPGFGKDRNSGARISHALEQIPVVGGVAKIAADIAGAPLTFLTAGAGAPIAAALKTAGPVGRAAAGFAAPILTRGNMVSRVGAETGVGLVSQVAGETVAEKTGSKLAGLGAGVLAGGLTLRTVGKARSWYTADDLPDGDPVRKLFDAVTAGRTRKTFDGPSSFAVDSAGVRAARPGMAQGALTEAEAAARGRGVQQGTLDGGGVNAPQSGPTGLRAAATQGSMDLGLTPGGRAGSDAVGGLRQGQLDLGPGTSRGYYGPDTPAAGRQGALFGDGAPGQAVPPSGVDPLGRPSVGQGELDLTDVRPAQRWLGRQTGALDPFDAPQPGGPRVTDPAGSYAQQGALGIGAGDHTPTARAGSFGQTTQGAFSEFQPSTLSNEDVKELYRRVNDHSSFRTANLRDKATAALTKVLTGAQPSDHELRLLDIAFGHGVSKQFAKNTGWSATLADVANVPRALMSSVDLSAPFRQGALLARRKAFWTSFKPMVEAFGSERRALEINDDIIETIARSGADKTSLYVASPFGKLEDREEAFMSGFAEHLPFLGNLVNRSERAYVTFLNKLRVDAFESMGQRFKTTDPAERAALMEQTAKWLNTATGRGNISPNSLMAHTNALFFSPRWFMSRVEVLNPQTWFNAPPELRAEMAKDVVSYVGAGLTALGILKASGAAFGFDVNIETDPRSSDFGKGKVGDTRYDLWAGFQPIARYAAQAITGQRKTASGDLAEADRLSVIGRFAQSKLAPVPGFLLDALRGETFLGQEVDVKTASGLSEQAVQRLAPLFVQDLLTAVHHEGPVGFLKTLPAGLGVGASTYTTFSGYRDKLALEDTGYPYERLTGTQKQLFNQVHATELAKYDEAAKEGSFRFEVERVNEDVRTKEREYATFHTSNRTSPREFNAVMQDLAAERAFRIQGVRDSLGVKSKDESLVTRWLALRDEATAGGVTDYSKLDQLQEDFKAGLTDPQDRAQVEDFTTFVHAPETKAYFGAKAVIRDAGYWQQEGVAFDRFAARVKAVDPSITTRRELELAAGRAETRAESIRLGGLLKLVDRERDRRRDLLKLRSKPLREAVDAVYSNKPLPKPKGGLTKIS